MIRSRKFLLVPAVYLLVLALALGLHGCGGGGGGGGSNTPSPSTAVFPLHVEAGKRYLVDNAGNPFFLHGDTAWSLIAQANDAEVDQYLEDRRQRGFNTILVNLLEHKFADNAADAGKNFYGAPPFTTTGNYATPNEAYFAHVDSVIQKATAKGILVLLTPSYVGFSGTDEGWYVEMLANGTTKMRDYGRFLGLRYKNFSNILWVNSGDYDPQTLTEENLIRQVALGIKENDTRSLQTAHGARETSPLPFWTGTGGDVSWIEVNNIYTGIDVPGRAQAAYADAMPFFMIEGYYENLGLGSEQRSRAEAYQAWLSGAMGYMFGNNPIWHFSSTVNLGANLPPLDWKLWLGSPGTVSMQNLRSLLATRSWWLLQPDAPHLLLTGGYTGAGDPFDLAVAAKASNGSFAVVYVPNTNGRPNIDVDVGQMAGPNIRARWYDPASGAFRSPDVAGSPFAKAPGNHTIPVPGNNASGSFTDWVLLLESIS